MNTPLASPAEVLAFWFGPDRDGAWAATPETVRLWFVKDLDFDATIVTRFGTTIEAALDGDARLASWETSSEHALALVIVLDQFTRNAFRGSGRMFAGDARALALAKRLVDAGTDRALRPIERVFVYLPFEHSESIADQERAIALFEVNAAGESAGTFASMSVDYARKHEVIIRRFGRFPHRNALLGRESTTEERDFLDTPGSSF
ncbi:MAG: DUF924 domain-containing protein [Myxococcales bacterium]|nr:DUF924 domain-containing protein [Myxococcales bacterium]